MILKAVGGGRRSIKTEKAVKKHPKLKKRNRPLSKPQLQNKNLEYKTIKNRRFTHLNFENPNRSETLVTCGTYGLNDLPHLHSKY